MRSELVEYHSKGKFITSAFIDVNGVPMLLSATILGDVDDRSQMDPANSPMLVIGQRLDDGIVENIATTYLLKDVMIGARAPTNAAAVEIKDDRGRRLVEALARWNSPNRGQVAPDDFIAIAEEYGFIHELGAFVLKSACDTLKICGELPIAINVSPIQLQDPGLCEKFQKIISDAGVRPEMIEIELTENVLVATPVLAKARLAQLSEAGFTISLDDYGTGFSSLGYLREFPFDKVKIDRSFVRGCGVDESKLQVLRSLSLLANAYDLAIVAEGVETTEQADFLRLMGYDFLQGFHFGRPMAMDVLGRVLSAERLAKAKTA